MFGRILLPLDGSKAGEAIIPYATQVAHALGSPLTLFHAASGGRVRGPVPAVFSSRGRRRGRLRLHEPGKTPPPPSEADGTCHTRTLPQGRGRVC